MSTHKDTTPTPDTTSTSFDPEENVGEDLLNFTASNDTDNTAMPPAQHLPPGGNGTEPVLLDVVEEGNVDSVSVLQEALVSGYTGLARSSSGGDVVPAPGADLNGFATAPSGKTAGGGDDTVSVLQNRLVDGYTNLSRSSSTGSSPLPPGGPPPTMMMPPPPPPPTGGSSLIDDDSSVVSEEDFINGAYKISDEGDTGLGGVGTPSKSSNGTGGGYESFSLGVSPPTQPKPINSTLEKHSTEELILPENPFRDENLLDDDDDEKSNTAATVEMSVTSSSDLDSEDEEKKASEPLPGNVIQPPPSYHPGIMFCGECTSCAPPPPPTFPMHKKKKKRSTPRMHHGMRSKHKRLPTSDPDEDQRGDQKLHPKDPLEVHEMEMTELTFPPEGVQHRTQIHIANLSCPSQILVINSVVQPLLGVTKILTNVNDVELGQMVYVDHDPLITSAEVIVKSLRDLGYEATVKKDGGLELLTDTEPHGLCRSRLYVSGICCNSEVPAVTSILKPIQGVESVRINVTTRNVYVDHDPFVVSASELVEKLNWEGFGAKVKKDGMMEMPARLPPSPASAAAASASAESSRATEKKKSATTGRSTFHINKILIEKDIPTIQQHLCRISGVTRIGINISEGIVYIEHDTLQSTAPTLSRILRDATYPNTIHRDASHDIQNQASRMAMANVVQSSKYVESTIVIPSMRTLSDCRKVQRTFKQNYIRAQVRAFYPHVPSHTVKVEHNPQLLSAPDIVNLLTKMGFEEGSGVMVDGAIENLALPVMEEYECKLEEDRAKIKAGMEEGDDEPMKGLGCNVILSGLFWVVSMLSIVGGNWEYLEYAGLLSVLFGLPPVATKAYRTVKRCQFDANCMMVIAAIGAIALQEYDEAASVAFLFAVSEWLEARATSKARKALGAIVSLRPDHANVIDPNTRDIVIVPASNVPIGSLVSVRTGDKVPADGVIIEGMSTIDESSLTGEARPANKRIDDEVSGGSINIGPTQLIVRTTSTVEDSAVSRLIRLVEEAQANRSPTEKLVDSFAKKYTPVVMLMAGLMCTLPWIWGVETGRYWTLNGLIIIVIACPCALTISTPVTYAAGLAATAQRGIIVKGGARLEALGSVKKVIFDKTGTLTRGKFTLIHLESVNSLCTRRKLLELLALMEAPSSHPLSATLVNAAKTEGVDIPRDAVVKDHTILKGEGVTADVNNERVYVGNARLFKRLGLYDTLPPQYKSDADDWNNAGGTVGFVGIDGRGIIGTFCVSDGIREEARDVVRALQEADIEVIMLTGDGDGAARAVGRQVGIPPSSIESQLLPEDKLHFIGSMKGTRPSSEAKACNPCRSKELILMCGDGVNDAPALAVADVGVAMGGGAALAMEMSDVTLMDSNLSKLLYSIKMGSKVILTIQENIVLSLVAKLLVVGLTFAGKMTLLMAIASDVGIMLVVTLNGMKLLPGRKGASLKEEVTTVSEQTGSSSRRKTSRENSKYDELPLEGHRHPHGVTTTEIV